MAVGVKFEVEIRSPDIIMDVKSNPGHKLCHKLASLATKIDFMGQERPKRINMSADFS